MNSFLNGLNGLIKNMKESPFVTLLALLVVLASYVALTNGSKIDQLLPMTNEQKIELDQKQDAADANIEATLETVREKTGAARTLVRQYHNGLVSADRRHLRRISTTHFVVRKGISAPDQRPMPFAQVAKMVKLMHPDYAPPTCVMLKTSEVDQEGSYDEYLRDHGVELFAQCPIMDLSETVRIGFVGLGFLSASNQKLSEEETLRELQRTADRIGGHLQEVKLEQPKPWWSRLLGK